LLSFNFRNRPIQGQKRTIDMSMQPIVLATAILLTGIMAGIFFTWSNAVMPGIGKLDDLEFLQGLKSMNRVILNNAFMAIFGGAMIAVFLLPVFNFSSFPKALFWFYVGTFRFVRRRCLWCDCERQCTVERAFGWDQFGSVISS